jgi:hypothetical protein
LAKSTAAKLRNQWTPVKHCLIFNDVESAALWRVPVGPCEA